MVQSVLGVTNGQLALCPKSPNCVSSQARDKKHFIEPIQFSGSRQEAKVALLAILELEKRADIVKNQQSYLLVEFTSALFRFVDDVEFYFLEDNPNETIIHLRSASRVGYSDFGANRKRIEKIREQF